MQVLVTGASGYIGGWCVLRLLQEGHLPVGTVRSEKKIRQVQETLAGRVDTRLLQLMEADLTSDDAWDWAADGSDVALHVASPLTGRSEIEMIESAREGTLRVLRGAVEEGVRRVVLTSSCAAATPRGQTDGRADESAWTDPDDPALPAYRRSKVLAEQAAWAFMADHPETELVTLLSASVLGPALSPDALSTLEILRRMLTGALPALPNVMLQVVDVRDVAAAHLRAMDVPEAAGRRFLLSGELMSLRDVADVLRREVPELSGRISRIPAPDWTVRAAARFVPALRDVVPLLGRTLRHDSSEAERVLGWAPRPAVETLVDSAWCLAEMGELGRAGRGAVRRRDAGRASMAC